MIRLDCYTTDCDGVIELTSEKYPDDDPFDACGSEVACPRCGRKYVVDCDDDAEGALAFHLDAT